MKKLAFLLLMGVASIMGAQDYAHEKVATEKNPPPLVFGPIDCTVSDSTIAAFSGCPFSTSGTITLTWADWAKNTGLFGPASGANAPPTVRHILPADLVEAWTDNECLIVTGGNFATTTCSGGSGNVATDSIWDAKGDLAAGTGANTATKVTVGANDTILMADSSIANGVKWAAVATTTEIADIADAEGAGTSDTYARGDHVHALGTAAIGAQTFWAAKGDLAGGTADNTAAVLTVGANDSILMAESGETTGLKWNAAATTTEIADASATAEAAGTSDTYARGDHVHLIPASVRTQYKTIVVGSPGAAENITIANLPAAATITAVCGVLIGASSPSVTYNVKYGSDRSAAGTAVTTSPTALTSTTTCTAAAALNNVAPSAGDHLWFITTAQSGTVTEIAVTVSYTIP